MTQQLRLLFDDCISKHAVGALQTLTSFARGSVEVKHLVDFALSGQSDSDWIPQIQGQGWIIIGTDLGKKNHGGKLPLISQRCLVSYVLMSPALHNKNTFDKIRALFAVWPDLLGVAADEPGCGYHLRIKNHGRGVLLECVYRPPGAGDVPKVQLGLGW